MQKFDTSRENSDGELVSWMKRAMSRPLRVIEEHADEILEEGVNSVRQTITEFDRIADPHLEKDGDESMIEGVFGQVTGSVRENMVNLKVGWDLTHYRHGYPQLQDKGFQGVVGMEALSTAKIAMQAKVQRLLANDDS